MRSAIVILVYLIALGASIHGQQLEEETKSLIKEGAKLKSEDVLKLEKQIRENPENLSVRTKLLSYYSRKKNRTDTQDKSYENHLIWIIQNHPDAEVAKNHITHVDSSDSRLYSEIKDLWFRQIETHKENAAVLGNAARFFVHHELDRSEDLLKQALALESNNTTWSEHLGSIYVRRMLKSSDEQKIELANKALVQLELTMSDTTSENRKYHLFTPLARAALEARELEKARDYAEEVLNSAPRFKDKWFYGRAVHFGNVFLGRLALESGNLEKAKEYLIKSGKTPGGRKLNSSGPDTTLAKLLLARGESEVVTKYFQLCSNFWKQGTDRLKSWIATVERGGMPVFDVNLEGTNTAIFTTGLNERKRPVDNIEEISITADKIYIFTYWHSLSQEKHDYLCNMYDGAGRLVFQNKMTINPNKDRWHTWTYHSLNKYVEKPGKWRFEIYIDGKKQIEKYLVVLNRFGQPFAEKTVRIAGKVTSVDGKPPVMAHVHLTNFHGNYRHALRTVAVSKDGLYSTEVYWPGLYRLFVTAVNHGHISIPIIVDDETQAIKLEVQLAPIDYNKEFDVVRIVGDWNYSYDFANADTMQKQADGTFVYERQVEADTIFYQLIGITRDPSNVSGTQTDYYIYHPEMLYCSVLKVNPGTVKIVFDPKKLFRMPDEIQPQVTFAKQNIRQPKMWDIDRIVQKQRKKYQMASSEYRKTDESMRDFHFDWSTTVGFLKERMRDDSDKFVQQFAAIQLAQLPVYRPGLESETILEIVDLVPPNSEIWSYEPLLPGRFAYQYGRAMEMKFLKTFVEQNPDRVVRGTSLAQLAMRIEREGNQEATGRYYERLKSEYGDLREIQHILQRLNPEKRIVAGKPVPDFDVKLLDRDETVSSRSLLGRFYLMDFWAVWCAPCIAEMENLHAVYEKFKNKNFTILSLSFDRKPQDVEKFRKEKWKMPWLNTFVEGGFGSALGKTFKVFGIPKPILVGPDGKILEVGNALRGEGLKKKLAKYIGT